METYWFWVFAGLGCLYAGHGIGKYFEAKAREVKQYPSNDVRGQ